MTESLDSAVFTSPPPGPQNLWPHRIVPVLNRHSLPLHAFSGRAGARVAQQVISLSEDVCHSLAFRVVMRVFLFSQSFGTKGGRVMAHLKSCVARNSTQSRFHTNTKIVWTFQVVFFNEAHSPEPADYERERDWIATGAAVRSPGAAALHLLQHPAVGHCKLHDVLRQPRPGTALRGPFDVRGSHGDQLPKINVFSWKARSPPSLTFLMSRNQSALSAGSKVSLLKDSDVGKWKRKPNPK